MTTPLSNTTKTSTCATTTTTVEITSLSFDNSQTRVQVGTNNGSIYFYQIVPFLQEDWRSNFPDGGSIQIVERIDEHHVAFKTSWNPQIYIYNIQQSKSVSHIVRSFPIVNCKSCLNGDIICIVTENEITIYAKEYQKSSLQSVFYKEVFIFKTSTNNHGVCELKHIDSSNDNNEYNTVLLVFPSENVGSLNVIEIQVNDLSKLTDSKPQKKKRQMDSIPTDRHSSSSKSSSGIDIKHRIEFKAHESSIRALYVDAKGVFIATASEKGTLIRLFQKSGTQIHQCKELKRGSYPCDIHSIAMSKNNDYLCCTGSSGTLHVFAIDLRTEKQEGGIFSYLSMIKAPITTTNEKSQYKMKGIDGKSICCFNKNDPSNIYVITDKGTFMECTFDYKDMNSTTEKNSYHQKLYCKLIHSK